MGSGLTTARFAEDLSELRRRWSDAGRPSAPELCCFFQPGTADEMARQIERGAQLGVQRTQVFLEDRGRDDVLPILDDIARVIGRWDS
jgi:hypothetical protein